MTEPSEPDEGRNCEKRRVEETGGAVGVVGRELRALAIGRGLRGDCDAWLASWDATSAPAAAGTATPLWLRLRLSVRVMLWLRR